MNQKEWRVLVHSKDKPQNFWYWRNQAKKYFNLQKGYVIHHLRDTEEQRLFNDQYYERWGFDLNNQMKYCICISEKEHREIHQFSIDTKNKMSESAKNRKIQTNKGRIAYNNGIKTIKIKPTDIVPEGFVKGTLITQNMLGHRPTKESIEKQWKTKRKRGTDKKSIETKRKMSEAAKKYTKTETHLNNIRKAAKKRRGRIPWNKGKKMSKEFCEKVSRLTKLAMNKPEIKSKLSKRNKK